MNDKKYTSADIGRTLSVSDRTARRYIEKHIDIKGTTKYISEEFYNLIIELETSCRTGDGQISDIHDRTEYFSEEEYQEFQKRLIEYPLIRKHIEALEKELEYHKNRFTELLSAHKSSLENTQQRNFIEAKEKRLDQ